MMKYVKQIRGKWTVRVTVPKKLRGLIGKRELVATDLSSKPREREAQAHRIINDFLGQIEQARARLALMEVSAEVLQVDIAKRRYAAMIEVDATKRANMPTSAEMETEVARINDVIDRQQVPEGVGGYWNLYADLEMMGWARETDARLRNGRLKALREAFKSGDTRWVDESIEAETRRLGLPIVKGSKEWHALAGAVMRAEIEALERTVERDRGDFSGTARDPLLTAPDPSLLGHTGKVASGRGITLSEALSAFHAERSAGGSALAPRTAEEHRNAVRIFNEFMGRVDLPIQSITKKDVINYKAALLETPKYYTTRFPGLSLPQAIEANKALATPLETLAAQTINMKWLSHLSTILQWASNNGHIDVNPANGIRVDTGSKTHRAASRTPFTASELSRIFGHALFEDRAEYGLKQWALLVMLHTGARNSSEIARMKLENIFEEQGVPVFYLADASKNERSKRLIPIHRDLIRLGFLDYVEAQRANDETYLFPEWQKRPDKVNDWFNVKFLPEVGIKASDKVFYCFRHTLATSLARAGVPREISKMITGHAPQDIAATYIQASPVTLMSECLNRVSFALPIPGLNYETDKGEIVLEAISNSTATICEESDANDLAGLDR